MLTFDAVNTNVDSVRGAVLDDDGVIAVTMIYTGYRQGSLRPSGAGFPMGRLLSMTIVLT